MNQITMKLNADKLIMMALQEDITSEDVSTNAVMPKAQKGKVDLICKQDGIIAGLDVYARVFTLLDDSTEVEFFCKDGDEVKAGQLMGVVTGDIRVLLSGERVALNYLQRMSGIATYTHEVAELLKGSKTTLLDTRKTTPNCLEDAVLADETFTVLMGEKVEPRKEFIEQNAKYAVNLDF